MKKIRIKYISIAIEYCCYRLHVALRESDDSLCGLWPVACGLYTSGDEIVHSIQYACKQKLDEIQAVNADKASDGVINGVEKVEKINSLTMPEVGEFCKDRLDESRALKASNDSSCVIEGIKGSCDDKDEAEASKAFRIGNGVSSKDLNRKRRCRESIM
ncbi:hypothetical protein Dsin_027465 [Dipteronia sinensis]|uniref:Uncharacterized protein n=1 Tax=Dipteronia sinensis TaxID=43782 RepID=A0AAD9ZP97_9ROSI|nr:hypothetical protein Dsin_027465 [Dipteronia sinensis]